MDQCSETISSWTLPFSGVFQDDCDLFLGVGLLREIVFWRSSSREITVSLSRKSLHDVKLRFTSAIVDFLAIWSAYSIITSVPVDRLPSPAEAESH